MFLLIPPVIRPIIILIFIPISSGLDCFNSYSDERHQLCSLETKPSYAATAEDCCNYSNAVAYATHGPTASGNVACTSCKRIRENSNVHCYQEIYWIGERSCHELHLELTTLTDCCVHRGASRNNTAQGFHYQKLLMNSTIPTYSCIPCAEAIFKASEWTAWSPCNSTCDGGYKTRKKICKKENKPSYAICIGEIPEIDNCNDHPCPHSRKNEIQANEWSIWSACNLTLHGIESQSRRKICRKSDNDPLNAVCVGHMIEIRNCNTGLSSTIIALVTIISLMAVVVTILVIYTCCKRKKRPNLAHQVRIPIELSEVRYQKSPMKRDLPIVPSKIEPDNHTYADIYANEDSNNGYLSMGGKKN